MFFRKKRLALMIMLTTLLLTACGGSIDKDIIGSWKLVNDGEVEVYWKFDEERLLARESLDDNPESTEYILTETGEDSFVLEIIEPSNDENTFLFEGHFENKDTIKPVENSDENFEIIRVDNITEELAEKKDEEAEAEVEQEKEGEEETEGEIITSQPMYGDIAPDFELKSIDGENVKLSDFRGKKVFLNFWASWTPASRAEMPDLQKLHENKDVVILAVDLLETEKEQNTELVEDFMEEYGITFNVLLDEESVVADEYDVKPVPQTYMIDSEGIIQNLAYGALTYELMVERLDEMD